MSIIMIGGIRVPAFVTGPMVPSHLQGTSFDGLFHMVDWTPTILELAGIPLPDDLDGISHASTLFSKSP